MNYVLYSRTLSPACESCDRETPELVCATMESNGYGVFCYGEDGKRLVEYFYNRDAAIEAAVKYEGG